MTALEELLSLVDVPDPFRAIPAPAELEKLKLAAAQEQLLEQRGAIPALDQRCKESGTLAIASRDDLVPLLFSHATYKTYPASFVANGRWDRMSRWLETVSTPSLRDIDMSGVEDADGWIARLGEAGYAIVATSGTSGKNSFLLMDGEDLRLTKRTALSLFAYPDRIPQQNDRPLVLLVPGNAPMRYCYSFRSYTEVFARPGAAATLTDEPMRVADSIRAAATRRAMADGSITPGELAAHGAAEDARRAAVDTAIRRITQRVLDNRGEPQIVLGPWATWWRLLELSREQGIPDGSFHPETVASISGGLKGLDLPPDYEDQMARFLGDVRRPKLYSMTELTSVSPRCEAGYYHCPPWMTLLILDESGERLLDPGADGWVTGRVAFYDPVWHGRWGGIISGDQATASYENPCDCGRPGPIVEDSVRRYSELSPAGDDKLTCGGTIEQYIRGVVGS